MNSSLPISPLGRRNHNLSSKPVNVGVVPCWWLVFLLFTGLSTVGLGQCFNRTTLYAQPGTLDVTVGDFNGDGKLDLASSSVGNSTVSVRLNNGSGFGAATEFRVGNQPDPIAAGDFNGDGKLDLVVANDRSTNVSVLLGTGSGGFGAATDFPIGGNAASIAVGDFNGDGRLDLATANYSSKTVSVLLGTGSGGFGAATNFGVDANASLIVVGDFNGDGRSDLAVTMLHFDNDPLLPDNVSVMLGDGSGGFGAATKFPVGRSPRGIALGDFNGDGRADLAVTIGSSNTVSVLLGTGNGGFGAATNFGVDASPGSVAVGDFNGDGRSDLAATIRRSNNDPLPDNVSVLLGDGSGGFGAATRFPVGRTFSRIAVGDFNGDGRPDLVSTGGSSADELSILINCAPPAGFTIASVTPVRCVTVSTTERQLTFTPQYAGLNGQPISFSVVNEMLPTTSPGPYTLRLYTDNPTIILKATQSGTAGEASFNYNWLASCSSTPVDQNGPACDTYTNRTTANGLGNNNVRGVYVVGSTVYAATDGGLAISTNGGSTFINRNTANGLGSNNVWRVFAVGSTVYAATNGGLAISTDGGNTFINRNTANGLGSNNVQGVFADGSTVYAATLGGLSISTNGGTNFTNKTIANGLGANVVNGVYVVGSTVYAATQEGLSISTDGGSTFTNRTAANGLGGNNVLAVYAVGSTVYAGIAGGGLAISTDGGNTFTNRTAANGLGGGIVLDVYAVGSTVYAATLGGLSISTDGGNTFTTRTIANGLGANQVQSVYVVGSTVYAATQGGLSFCPPSPTSSFAITGATVNCQTVSTTERRVMLTPQYAGLNGQPISFSVVNEMLPTTSPGPYTLRLYTDNLTITLKATQSGTPGEASFNYNWLAACNGGSSTRMGVSTEPTAKLQVKILGNPVREALEVDVTGSNNMTLYVSLTDIKGRLIDQRRTERAGASEHYRFDVSNLPPGTLLLRASSEGQLQTVRVLKVN
ncbi:FG-GAP-like repeat-containing protein [Spirosoma luteum]|uniref:FG-GAP-like repeat-containing protein n=1 Tax=Spirosoma luteum TaxID=431553 RepID=UPI000360AC75|nr:FG-GAP-like repeat-containing protein [Spirosoma luteum]